VPLDDSCNRLLNMKLQHALRIMGPIVLLTGVSALLSSVSQALPNAQVGVVVSSQRALLGGSNIVDGTSLFDGDTLSTQEKGSLRIRIGAASLAIDQNSTLTLRRNQQVIRAVLIAGTAQFSIPAESHLVIDAPGATIFTRQGSASGVAAVVNENEFQIGSTRGSLNVDVDGDVRTVEEGMNYDVTLSVSDNPAIPVRTGKKWKIASWTLITVIAGLTALAVQRATLSQSHPHL
jgi:hypothetical protein